MADKIITTITTGTNLTVKAFAEEPPITVKTLSAGPGVSTSLEMKNLLDVDDTAEADGRILKYDAASDKHIYIDRFDSASATGLVDSAYVQLRQIKYTTADFTDSSYVASVLPVFGIDFVDSAYVTSVLPTLGNDFVDSAYVTNLPISTFTNDADYLDSTTVLGVINQSYVQTNQITYSTNDFTDSAYVQSVLPTLGGDFVDSAYVTSLPVSTFSNDANYLDSTTATEFIDSAYVQLRQIKYTTADFTDSAYVTSVLPTLGGDFVDSAYVTGLPVSTFTNDANYLDSTTVQGVIDQTYVQTNQIKYTTADFTDSAYVTSVLPTLGNDFVDSAYVTSLPVSTFTNDANYLDSTTVTGVINSSYIQTNQITYNTSDFADSAFVSAQINALIDGAPGTLDTLNEIAAALNDDDSAVNSLTTLINAKDSDFVKSAADQTYIQSQQIKYSTADFTDSAYVTSVLPTLGGDFVDSAYVASVLPTLGGDFVDSAFVTSLPISTFTNDADYLDSTTVLGVVNQTYIQNNQIKYTTADFTDSAYVTSVLPTLGGDFVDSSYVTSLPVSTFSNDANYLDSTTVVGVIDQTYVQNNQIKYTTADFTDSAYVTSVLPTLGGDYVDSAYVTGLPVSTFANDADYLDSTTVLGVIDQTYVQNNQIKYTTADFTDSAYVTSVLPTLGGDFVDSAQVSAIIIADVVKSFVDALNINAVELGGNDSDYYRLNVYDSAGVLLN
jgi:arginine exporter protein ArgO